MTPTLLVLASVTLGAIVGAAITATVFAARAVSRRHAAEMRPELPEIATSILNEMETFAVILDASLSPVYANPVAFEDPRISGEELSDPDFLRLARQVMTSGIPYTRQPQLSDPGDTLRIHIVRVQPRFLVVLADDVAEEQRVNAMRRDFIANVSHEFKTPIAAVGLLAEAVQEAAEEPELVRDFSKSLQKEAKRLATLSRDIIRLSEAQSTLSPENREVVLVSELVAEEVDAHRNYAKQRGIDIVFAQPSDKAAEASVIGNPAALGVAIANLLGNAIQHSPEGGSVGVGLEIAKRALTVTVTDQGSGIAVEHLSRIFERFYRVDDSRSRDGGGTGLGLSIARHTLRAHGGDIDVWSQPGHGSSFILSLPFDKNTGLEKKPAKKLKKLKKLKRQLTEATPEHTTKGAQG